MNWGQAILGLSAALALLSAQAATAAPVEPATALSLIGGSWQVADNTGEVVISCQKPQKFALSSDHRTVSLTEDSDPPFSSTYLVLHSEKDRVLMFVENESRRTKAGDPVLWWATFNNSDEFRWRRYDWAADATTDAVWKRCK